MMTGQLDTVLHHVRRLAGVPGDDPRTDRQLLRQFAADSDQAAFAVLLRRHGPLVLGVCRRVLRDFHAAEDAFQATFLLLARKARSVSWQESAAGWLCETARHLALKARTAAARRRVVERQAVDRRAERSLDASPADALPLLLDEELCRLPEKYRGPLVLCYLEGRSHAEAACHLGWPVGTVKGRLARARDLLRERLRRGGWHLPAAGLGTLLGDITAGAAVTVPLQQTTLQTACRMTAGVASLSSLVVAAAKQKGLVALLLILSVLGAGTGLIARKVPFPQPSALAVPAAPEAAPAKPPDEKQAHTDHFGDPLPPDALARIGTVRMRHGDHVSQVAFVLGGKTLLSKGWDGVRLWDVTTGRQVRHIGLEPLNLVRSTSVALDGRTLATANRDGTLRLWDLATGKVLREFPVIGRFSCVLLAPDGKTLAVWGGSDDKAIRLWEVATGKEIGRLAGHKEAITALVFSRDGKALISCGDDRTIRVRDLATGKELRCFDPHPGAVGKLALSPDGKTLASVGMEWKTSHLPGGVITRWEIPENVVRLWDMASGKEIRQLTGHQIAGVIALTFSPDGKTLVSTGLDQTMRFWEVASGKQLRQFKVGFVGRVAWSADGKALALAEGRAVRLLDATTGKSLLPWDERHQVVERAVPSPDGRLIATTSPDYTILLWDIATGKERGRLIGHTAWVDGMVFGPGGRSLVSASSQDQTIRLWDPGSGREVCRLPTGPDYRSSLALAPDGRTVAAGGKDWVRLWDLATGAMVRVWNTRGKPVDYLPMAFAPDGRTLCTWNHTEKAVYLWDATRGQEVRHFSAIEWGPPFAWSGKPHVTFSSDGRLAAFGGQVGTLTLLDTTAGKEIGRRREAPGRPFSAMSFSPDGRMLALASQGEGTIRLWETATLTARRQLTGHQLRVQSLAFAADGRTLVSTGADTTALVWDVFGLPAREQAQEPRPSPRQLEQYWADLRSAEGRTAHAAMGRLVRAPGQAAPFLARHLLPVPEIDAALRRQITRLIAELDAEAFAVRERALQELEELKDAAEPALRQALAGQPTPELRHRLQVLLGKLDPVHPSPDRLRDLRALEVLEYLGNAEARRLLQALARGADGAYLTQEAKASLQRLARRAAARP